MFWDESIELNSQQSYSQDEQDEEELLDFNVEQLHYCNHGIDLQRVANEFEIQIVLDEIICPICQMIVHEPVFCQKCEAHFCRNCAYSWVEKATHQNDCPCCRGQGTSKLFVGNENKHIFFTDKIPKIMQVLLSKIKIKCIHTNSGCTDLVSYDSLLKHEKECIFQKISCRNAGCNISILKRDFEKHQQECPYGLVHCTFCFNKVKRNKLDQHIKVCDYRQVDCQHCKKSLYACELLAHEANCDQKIVQCNICKNKFIKKDFSTHTPTVCYKQLYHQKCIDYEHMSENVLKLEVENKSLKKNCLYLSKQLIKYKKSPQLAGAAEVQLQEECDDYEESFESYQEVELQKKLSSKISSNEDNHCFQQQNQLQIAPSDSTNNNQKNVKTEDIIKSFAQNCYFGVTASNKIIDYNNNNIYGEDMVNSEQNQENKINLENNNQDDISSEEISDFVYEQQQKKKNNPEAASKAFMDQILTQLEKNPFLINGVDKNQSDKNVSEQENNLLQQFNPQQKQIKKQLQQQYLQSLGLIQELDQIAQSPINLQKKNEKTKQQQQQQQQEESLLTKKNKSFELQEILDLNITDIWKEVDDVVSAQQIMKNEQQQQQQSISMQNCQLIQDGKLADSNDEQCSLNQDLDLNNAFLMSGQSQVNSSQRQEQSHSQSSPLIIEKNSSA